MEKYSLTDAHRAQLKPWGAKWIANALRCGEYTQGEKDAILGHVSRLYAAAELSPPRNVVVCPDPVSAALAWSYAAGIWWLRKNPQRHIALFGRVLAEADYARAVEVVCSGKVQSVTRDATYAATNAATRDATDDATYAATRDATYAATRDATLDATRDATLDATDDATRDATNAATHAATYAATYAATRDATYDDVARFLRTCTNHWSRGWNGGNQWSGWVSYLSFFRHVAKLPIDYGKWDTYEAMATYGPRYMHTDFCIVAELPESIHRDAEHRPHCETGPFCRWRSGRALYYWHGTEVPREWIESPETLDPATALTWENIEQRRCAAEIIGWARVLDALDVRVIDADPDPLIGRLVEVDLPDAGRERFLDVQCGTGRRFALAVPPEMTTALQAQAWTYGVDSDDIKQSEART